MVHDNYLLSYKNYFWQLEEDNQVIAIPGGSTIAYSNFVAETLQYLAPSGFPPFGSLLLAIIATNANAAIALHEVFTRQNKNLDSWNETMLTDAISFLNMVSSIPEEYKKGEKRLLLFQVLFEDCHNSISALNAKKILQKYPKRNEWTSHIAEQENDNSAAFRKDFRTIYFLKKKFPDIAAILSKMAALPGLEEDLVIEENNPEQKKEKDFVDELTENEKTFSVAALVRRIWSGLNIPMHSNIPSEQPLGGISDLTNKGEFDKLLISEFANEDLVLLSRLANNEALYLHREIPPTSQKLKRIILIDVSLKNWGSPKTIAFATMLAIAHHPKTDIVCESYLIGHSFHPLQTNTVSDIIEGLQILEGSINAASGINSFFSAFPDSKNREVFFITEQSTPKQAAMLKAMTEYNAKINYLIYTNAEGHIDVYKKQHNSRRHLQHIELPLHELWLKKERKSKPIPPTERQQSYPLLLRNSSSRKKILSTENGDVYEITNDKCLMKFYGLSSKKLDKGWDLIYENLPFASGQFEIGNNENNEPVLLLFNAQNRRLILLDIKSGVQKKLTFSDWVSSIYPEFIFNRGAFQYLTKDKSWTFELDGAVFKKDQPTFNHLEAYPKRQTALQLLAQHYNLPSKMVFKNLNVVYINQVNNLVFNTHELYVNNGGHIKIDHGHFVVQKIMAQKESDNKFIFSDGSIVELRKCGVLLLQSSNPNIPTLYLPSVIDVSLGMATEKQYAGSDYFYKDKDESIERIPINHFFKKFVHPFIDHILKHGT